MITHKYRQLSMIYGSVGYHTYQQSVNEISIKFRFRITCKRFNTVMSRRRYKAGKFVPNLKHNRWFMHSYRNTYYNRVQVFMICRLRDS